MKKREGFHLLREVNKYLKHTEKDELFVPCNMLIYCVCFFPRKARVCECMLLVYTAQYEGEGRKCRLPGQTGKSKFLYYISGLGTKVSMIKICNSFLLLYPNTLSTQIQLLFVVCILC